MPIFPEFPSNPTQLAQIVADIHDQKHLPLKYDTDDRRRRPDLRHGWIIGDVQRKIIVDWLLDNAPSSVCRYAPTWKPKPDVSAQPGDPEVRMTALLSGHLFAWHHKVDGGVTLAHTLDENGDPAKATIFFFETNEIVPEDRCTPEEWGLLARALQITGQATWYLHLIC